MRRKGAWAAGAAFAAFSGAVALGWLYGVDLWTLQTVQEHSWGFLDAVLNIFSLLGSVEAAELALLVMLMGLFLRGRQELAGRLLMIFVATGIMELVMKLYLPQVPVPEGEVRTEDFAPLVAVAHTYSYPSGHMLRSVILLGAFYLLSGSRFSRVGMMLALLGLAAGRIYPGAHWASDVVGEALLGLAGLLWAFGKEDLGWRSR
jgi:membrane-associated phospholipid phosphatase